MNRWGFEILNGAVLAAPFLRELAIWCAVWLPYFIIAGAILSLVFVPTWRRRFRFLLAGLLSVFIARILFVEIYRAIYPSPRPFRVLEFAPLIPPIESFSFPSGHMSLLLAIAVIAWSAHRRIGIVLAALAVVVGLARIAVGVHWPFDILGGMVVGVLSAFLAHRLVRMIR